MRQPKIASKTTPRPSQSVSRGLALGWLLIIGASGLTGCQSTWEQIRGPGFPGWAGGESVRGKNADAKPSGFFTSRKADQIEQNLGGGY